MKKTSVVALAALIGGTCVASAAPSLKEICLSNPETFVWVEKTYDCATVHPCGDPSDPHYAFYCNTAFKDIQVSSVHEAQELANLFVSKRMGVKCSFLEIQDAKLVGQDYLGCKTSDGGFIEFEFDDYSESTSSTAEFSYALGKCIAYGGKVLTEDMSSTQDYYFGIDDIIVRNNVVCLNVTEQQCKEMYYGTAFYNPANKSCMLRR
jgi:hypothetical protein